MKWVDNLNDPLRKKCPYSEFFWSEFSRIRTKYGVAALVAPLFNILLQEGFDRIIVTSLKKALDILSISAPTES